VGGRSRRASPAFRPLDPANVIHLGGRDFDLGEASASRRRTCFIIRPSELTTVTAKAGQCLRFAGRRWTPCTCTLTWMSSTVSRIANAYAAARGLSVEELNGCLRACLAKLPVRAFGADAYDPDFDPAGTVAEVAAVLIELLALRGVAEAVFEHGGLFEWCKPAAQGMAGTYLNGRGERIRADTPSPSLLIRSRTYRATLEGSGRRLEAFLPTGPYKGREGGDDPVGGLTGVGPGLSRSSGSGYHVSTGAASRDYGRTRPPLRSVRFA